MSKIDELPRKAVLGYLELTRLPLTAAERALGKTEGTWGPTIVADRVQARIKKIAGTVLRDETLRADANLQHAALDERLRAAAAETEAERIRAEADRRLAAEQRAIADEKRAALQRDEQREKAIDARAEADERKVIEKTVAKKAAARKVAAAQEEALEQRETKATRERLAKESKALNDQRAAAEAKAEVLDLEDKLNEVKAARKQA